MIQYIRQGFKLGEPSPSNVPQKWGGPPKKDTITVAHITDCPTITVHAGKCYKALIDSEPLYHYSGIQPTKKLKIVTRCPYNPPQPN